MFFGLTPFGRPRNCPPEALRLWQPQSWSTISSEAAFKRRKKWATGIVDSVSFAASFSFSTFVRPFFFSVFFTLPSFFFFLLFLLLFFLFGFSLFPLLYFPLFLRIIYHHFRRDEMIERAGWYSEDYHLFQSHRTEDLNREQ